MFAIAGGKGGCGKTTLTLGIAARLAEAGERPLVVDTDCDMPDVHLVAEVTPDGGIDTLAAGSSPAEAIQWSERFPGVALVPAGTREHVDAALHRLSGWSGTVLLDLPAGASADATKPLRHATGVVLVATDAPQSLADAGQTARCGRTLGTPPVAMAVRRTGRTEETVDRPDYLSQGVPVVEVPAVESPIEQGAVIEAHGFRRVCEELSRCLSRRMQARPAPSHPH